MTSEEIRQLVETYLHDPNESACIHIYLGDLIALHKRVKQAEANNGQLARYRRGEDLDAESQALVSSLRALVARQDGEIARLKKELRVACESNHRKNKELDAMHWIWCDGGCVLGAHRYDRLPHTLNAEIIQIAERNVARMKRWYAGWKARKS